MEKSVEKITESELEVMKVLWKANRELTVTDIRVTLEEKSKWKTSTIKTLLRRLCSKEVISQEKKEVFYYKALVSEEEFNDYSTQKLIDKVYLGSAKNLVSSLISSKKLNNQDINELRMLFKVEDNKNE